MPPREDATLTLYTWGTPNGYKPLIMLEELELPYQVVPIDLRRGQQHEDGYLSINPNGKIPALVDKATFDEEIHVFESGAILLYLAEKTSRFLPADGQARADALAWLMFQMSAVGPMLGQAFHFTTREDKQEYPIERYTGEVRRLLAVLDRRLGTVEYLAGPYGIADMATFTWVQQLEKVGLSWSDFPQLAAWSERIAARPAVRRAMDINFG